MPETNQLEQRVVELEELFAHHERLVQQLNEVVVELRAELSIVQTQSFEQQARIRMLSENQESQGDPFDEKPPHY
jgi:uncharacterized coiled-coil protein SlyX